MKSRLIFSWALFFDAFRSGGILMAMQGVMCLILTDSDKLHEWGRGSVLIGLLFWAAWAISKQLGVGNDRDMSDTSF